eukprot:g6800.t1
MTAAAAGAVAGDEAPSWSKRWLALFAFMAGVYVLLEVGGHLGRSAVMPALVSSQTIYIVVGVESLTLSLLAAVLSDLWRARPGRKQKKTAGGLTEHDEVPQEVVVNVLASPEPPARGRKHKNADEEQDGDCNAASSEKSPLLPRRHEANRISANNRLSFPEGDEAENDKRSTNRTSSRGGPVEAASEARREGAQSDAGSNFRACFDLGACGGDGILAYMPIAGAFAVFNLLQVFQNLLIRDRPGTLAVLQRLTFVLVVLGSRVLLKRRFSWLQYVCAALVLFAIVLFQFASKHAAKREGGPDAGEELNVGIMPMLDGEVTLQLLAPDTPPPSSSNFCYALGVVLSVVGSFILVSGTLFREKALKKRLDQPFFVQKFHLELSALFFSALFLFLTPEVISRIPGSPEPGVSWNEKLHMPLIRSWHDLLGGWYDEGGDETGARAWQVHTFAVWDLATQWCGDLLVKRASSITRSLLKFTVPVLAFYLGDRLIFGRVKYVSPLTEAALAVSSLLLVGAAGMFSWAAVPPIEEEGEKDLRQEEAVGTGDDGRPFPAVEERSHHLAGDSLTETKRVPCAEDAGVGAGGGAIK